MKKLDRRVIRTRQLLRDSLMSLILEKGYDAVTVQEITDRANLGRATFYLHYKDKEELLAQSLTDTFDQLVAQMGPLTQESELIGTPIGLVFTHAAENSDLYRVILSGQGGHGIRRKVQAYMAAQAKERLLPLMSKRGEIPDDLLANYMAGSLLGLVDWWLQEGMPHPVEQMIQTYRRLVFLGTIELLGIEREQLNLTQFLGQG